MRRRRRRRLVLFHSLPFTTGRFLNVFREDDRVTKAIFEFVEPIAKGPEAALVQALFFARWCNRDTTLKAKHIPMKPGCLIHSRAGELQRTAQL